jgi:hypothetical protein
MGVEITTYSEITFDQLREMTISHGDLYWKKASGKFTKVLNSGERVEFEKLAKFEKVTTCLFIDSKTNLSFVEKGAELLKNLVNETDEIRRIEIKEEFLAHIYSVFWAGQEEGTIFDFVLIFKNAFYNLNSDFSEAMDSRAFMFYQRSALTSALNTTLAICSGYTNGLLLKDLYNTCYYFDYSYALNEFSSLDIERLEEQRSSHENLQSEGSRVDEAFKSYDYKYEHSNLSHLISYHHERLSGNGSIIKSNQDEIGDLEKIVIFVDSIISFAKDDYFYESGKSFIKNILEVNEVDLNISEAKFLNKLSRAFSVEEKEEEVAA